MSKNITVFPSHKWLAFFTQYWLLKLLALIITILVYWSVARQIGKDFIIDKIPVRIAVQESLVPLEDVSRLVTVRLRGTIGSHRKFDAGDISIYLRTEDAHIKGSTYSWELNEKNVRVPWGTQFLAASPNRITLNIDSIQHKTLPVEPVFGDRDKLPSNVELGKVTLVPAEIQIDAPASVLKSLKKIRTKPIPLLGISQSFDCDIELDQEHYSKMPLPKTKIMVQVEIVSATRTRVFKNLPVKILTVGASKQPFTCEIISSPAINATVTGPKNLIETLRREDLVPCIDISKFEKPGRYDIDVHCLTSIASVRIKQIVPQRVTIQLLAVNSK